MKTKHLISVGSMLLVCVPLLVWSKSNDDTDPSERDSSKVEVCHNGHIISVSSNALGAHLAHGDEELDDDHRDCPVVDSDDGDDSDSANNGRDDDDASQDNGGDDDSSGSGNQITLNLDDLSGPVYADGYLYIPQLAVNVFGGISVYGVILEFKANSLELILKQVVEVDEARDDVVTAEYFNGVLNAVATLNDSDRLINLELTLYDRDPVSFTISNFSFVDN